MNPTFMLGGELEVRRLGFGAMRIVDDREEGVRVLRRAVELGVNFIDTGDIYGAGRSEEIIAEALHPYPDGLVITTKGGLGWGLQDRIRDGRPEHLREACEASLRRLKLERIDFWQLHRIDENVSEEKQFGTIQQFVREGKVRCVGLSEVTVEQIERARRFFTVVSVQNRYNVSDREWESVVEYCERERIGFIPWYPLNAGRIADKPLETIASKHNAKPAQVALAWLLRRSPVILPIPGTSKVAHLEENMAAASINLSDEEMKSLA